MRVGVLSLQGDVREHVAVLESAGAEPVRVRRAEELEGLDGLIIPGGESTAILHLLGTSGLRAPLGERLSGGLPVLGTCAGLIALAHKVVDGRADQWSYDLIDVGVRRNGYGRQIASFEAELDVAGVGSVHGVFIRAPRIESWGGEVEVLATLDRGDGEHPVLVRQGSVWGASFHPELARDDRVHRLFLATL
ncbi:MAG TPA: pyridoxal 5'-phosphate synthase glutaminase subunit PdxT [Acidimicrobiales bacterium]|nr:pyridoxal 5'-phosphate synthase glutaminase subunit PdxT [Acidimicrobiales bacterium]